MKCKSKCRSYFLHLKSGGRKSAAFVFYGENLPISLGIIPVSLESEEVIKDGQLTVRLLLFLLNKRLLGFQGVRACRLVRDLLSQIYIIFLYPSAPPYNQGTPMKPTKPILTALAAICLAAPVSAQDPVPPPPEPNIDPDTTPTRPERPARPELASELKTKLDAYKLEHEKLRNALKARLARIENPTREKIRRATHEFKTNHEAKLLAQKLLAAQIKEGLKTARPDRPEKPEVSDEVKTQVKTLQTQHKEIHQSIQASKAALKTALQDVTREERKQLLDKFRQDQKDLHEQMKGIQRQIRETMAASFANIATTDTRTELRRPPTRTEVQEARRTSDR